MRHNFHVPSVAFASIEAGSQRFWASMPKRAIIVKVLHKTKPNLLCGFIWHWIKAPRLQFISILLLKIAVVEMKKQMESETTQSKLVWDFRRAC